VATLTAVLVAGCTHPGNGGGSTALPASRLPSAGQAGQRADPAARAASIVATLTDEDLVGQVLMPYAFGNDATSVSSGSQAANRRYAGVATPAEMVTRYRLGGMILVGWSGDDPTAATNKTTNVESAAQVRRLTTGLQTAAAGVGPKVPLLIGTDQEYGVVTRIRDGVVALPSALALGAGHDPAATEQAWRVAGTDLAAAGINVDFAPDADVLGDRPGGPIGSRSFGSGPAAVADQVAAAVRGLRGGGVAATVKHFPGHGRTTDDSHTGLPALGQSADSLRSVDLAPFRAGVAAGAELVMSGHLDVKAIDPGVPASFSSAVLIGLLRQQLGFTGVVVTDALNMAPAERWPAGEAAVRALVAGNDLLLMPPDLAAAQRGLLDGLHSGALPRQRLVEAVTRVLTLRLRLAATPQPAMTAANTAAGRATVARATAGAVTVLRGACRGALVRGTVRITASSGHSQQRAWLTTALRAAGVTVVDSGGTTVHLVGYGDNAADLAADAGVTVAMDTPYLLSDAASPTLLATYASTAAAMDALAAVLAGRARAPGRSPVAVDKLPRTAC
jgi:beta-N-acetylhexosaminidase